MSTRGYVHTYETNEAQRLRSQAQTLHDILHQGTRYPAGSLVLEAGCGVGAQTVGLLADNPGIELVSLDISLPSLVESRAHLCASGLCGVRLLQADVLALPFADETFDHVFVCFLLEHLADPVAALRELRRVVKHDGTITAIEGDHGSCFFHPQTEAAIRAWWCLTELQARLGGDALIGRRLYPLFVDAELHDVRVEPRPVWCDPSRPDMMDGFADKTICGMLRGIAEQVVAQGLLPAEQWQKGFDDVLSVSRHPRGSMFYTFFEAVGTK